MPSARSRKVRPLALLLTISLSGCAGSTLTRKPDGTYERDRRSTIERNAADALRRGGASTEAQEAQKRAEKSAEEERKNPVGTYLTDILYGILGIAIETKSNSR